MTIFRNGQNFILTDSEIEQIYKQRQQYYDIADIRLEYEFLCGEKFDGTDDQLKIILEEARSILSKNDSYWESYWDSIDYAIREFKEELLI